MTALENALGSFLLKEKYLPVYHIGVIYLLYQPAVIHDNILSPAMPMVSLERNQETLPDMSFCHYLMKQLHMNQIDVMEKLKELSAFVLLQLEEKKEYLFLSFLFLKTNAEGEISLLLDMEWSTYFPTYNTRIKESTYTLLSKRTIDFILGVLILVAIVMIVNYYFHYFILHL